eukprot:647343-Pyramimonas_sp.AAC.1
MRGVWGCSQSVPERPVSRAPACLFLLGLLRLCGSPMQHSTGSTRGGGGWTMPWARCRGLSTGLSTPGIVSRILKGRHWEGRAGRPERKKPCPSTGPSASRPHRGPPVDEALGV